jgi:myo-inositol catabolism protein IolH
VLEHYLDDFIEDVFETVDIISGINHPLVSFGFYALYTDHMGGDIAGIMEYASPRLMHVPVADTVDFRAFSASRYLLNPPGTHARIHQHLDIGQGEVNWDTFFSTLSGIRFEGVKTSCVFTWEERVSDLALFNLAQIRSRMAWQDSTGWQGLSELDLGAWAHRS